MSPPVRTLVWFRGKDLRVTDHQPLIDAAAAGDVLPLFVLDPYFFAPSRARQTPHRIQFLLESAAELATALAARGSRLLVVEGRSVTVVPRLAQAWRVDRVVAHGWAAPVGRERDRRIAAALSVPFDLYEGETLLLPGTLRSGSESPYRVFTAFARAFHRAALIGARLPAPRRLPGIPPGIDAASAIPSLAALGITRNPRVLRGGEMAGRRRLERFLSGAGPRYATGRDRMDEDGTSRLSSDLKFGTLSVRTVWNAASRRLRGVARDAFLNELVWREFMHHTIADRPDLASEPFRAEFRDFPWTSPRGGAAAPTAFWKAWVEGRTGYPIVDASARQLLAEGFVHNRARMISASFLTKHLLIDYRFGERHYMQRLTDGDWANNNGGWQWAAGCGADAQPYFRVFNPVTQGQRFDPSGAYVRRWVPELTLLPDKYLHAPWSAPPDTLRAAGIVLGRDYPYPVVDHADARAHFLDVAKRHLRARRRVSAASRA